MMKFTAVAMAAALLALAPSAFAKDDGGSGLATSRDDDDAASEPRRDTDEPRDVVVCEEGQVFHDLLERCIDVPESGLDDQSLLDAGRDLALAGHFREALPVLAAADQTNAVVLTYQGFANRKLGRYDEAFAFYDAALEIDPNSALTLSYMGEGYVALGQMDAAQAALERIEEICGVDCGAYIALAEAIETDGDSGW